MTRSLDYSSAGENFSRRVFARTLTAVGMGRGEVTGARSFAEGQVRRGAWRDTPAVGDAIEPASDHFMVSKAAVGAIALDASWQTPAATFVEDARAEAIIGRLPGLRRLPFRSSALLKISGVGAAWVSGGKPIPCFSSEFEPLDLRPLELGSMIVATSDFIEFAGRNDTAAQALADDLRGAVVEKLDATFAGSDAAVAGESPAGLASVATTVSSSGSTVAQIANDITAMLAVVTGAGLSLRTAAWVMSHEAAAFLRLVKIADASGESLAGRPIIESNGARGSLLLAVGERIAVAMPNVVSVAASREGAVEMRDDPSDTSPELISLFQTGSVALRAVLFADWQVRGELDTSGASPVVVALSGASWV